LHIILDIHDIPLHNKISKLIQKQLSLVGDYNLLQCIHNMYTPEYKNLMPRLFLLLFFHVLILLYLENKNVPKADDNKNLTLDNLVL